MEAKFHEFGYICETCGKTLTILAVSFSADGFVNIDGICVVCGDSRSWTKSWEEVMKRCWEADLAGSFAFIKGTNTVQ